MSTELIAVSALAQDAVAEVTERLLTKPGTAVAHHDLSEVASGVIRLRLRQACENHTVDHTAVLEVQPLPRISPRGAIHARGNRDRIHSACCQNAEGSTPPTAGDSCVSSRGASRPRLRLAVAQAPE
ncbi:MAG: hypothetical protein J2P19_29770 [Pseudonocardia sp.]|nr:hypothetical protein [Pseudonocardia sp.]